MLDIITLREWQNWRTGLVYKDPELGVKIIGALDECLTDSETYMPFDYKTKGSEPKDDGSQYYQLQMDLYTLMLDENGYPTNGKAYIAYFWPIRDGVRKLNTPDALDFAFEVKVFEYECSITRAKETIAEAVKCLEGKRPPPNNDCDHCNFVLDYPKEDE